MNYHKPFFTYSDVQKHVSRSLSASLWDLSALWLAVCAYQSHRCTQAVTQMSERRLSMSVVSSLVVRALICLWQTPVVGSLPHSSQCQTLNGKSHCEGLFINIDLFREKQRGKTWGCKLSKLQWCIYAEHMLCFLTY